MWILFLLIFDGGGASGRSQKTITTVEFSSQERCIEAIRQSVKRERNSVYDAWCVKK